MKELSNHLKKCPEELVYSRLDARREFAVVSWMITWPLAFNCILWYWWEPTRRWREPWESLQTQTKEAKWADSNQAHIFHGVWIVLYCPCVCVCACVCVCTCACVCVHVCVHVHSCVCMCAHIITYVCVSQYKMFFCIFITCIANLILSISTQRLSWCFQGWFHVFNHKCQSQCHTFCVTITHNSFLYFSNNKISY